MTERFTKQDLEMIYSLMEKSFPSDEYRTKAATGALFDDPAYRVIGRRDGDKICAIAAMWELESFLFIEHLAVDPEMRCGGIGQSLLREAMEESKLHVCLEVELPETDIARRRIGFYERNGFFLNDYPYYQPPMAEGKSKVPLLIMTSGRRISPDEFASLRDLLYRKVYKYKCD